MNKQDGILQPYNNVMTEDREPIPGYGFATHTFGVVNAMRGQKLSADLPDGVPFSSAEILQVGIRLGVARISPSGFVQWNPAMGENAGHEYWKAVRRERAEG